jgi:hypothetical protein
MAEQLCTIQRTKTKANIRVGRIASLPNHGKLTEGVGFVQLTSLLRAKVNNIFNIKIS